MRSEFVLAGVLLTFCVGPALGVMTIDLTAPGAVATGGSGEIWESFDPDNSTGTGVFEPFVRIQGKGEEQGYNTDGTLQWDTKSGTWTHSLLLTAVPYFEVGGVGYREFLLDADQTGSAGGVFLTIDKLIITLEAGPSLTDYSTNILPGPVIYDLDSGEDRSVRIDASLFASGSGTGDVRVLIPDALFTGTDPYVYLYALMGTYDAANNGFEEWGVRVGGTPPPPPPPPPPVPAPDAVLLSGIGIGLVGWLRRKNLV